jgi:hypothetical protein
LMKSGINIQRPFGFRTNSGHLKGEEIDGVDNLLNVHVIGK